MAKPTMYQSINASSDEVTLRKSYRTDGIPLTKEGDYTKCKVREETC